MTLLRTLAGPADLRALDPSRLPALTTEIRDLLVSRVSATGGHLGVNLGVVELTIALHRVFRSPRDVFLFDTGHQAYVHKILTGRWTAFDRLRRDGGLSGYPSRAESAHDWVENSHASTALSYADGVANALRLKGEPADRRVVAVIGDGALTGGLAWEGLNNLSAAPDRPVVVVLNDNGRSYAPTVGGLARHLARLREGAGSPLFEELGLAYLGPVDGHDIPAIEAALRRAAGLDRTVVVHVVTRKGHGYPPAEADEADRMHGVGVIDPATGSPRGPRAPGWTDVFGMEIAEIGAERPDVVCLTAAMLRPVGLLRFARRFPDRVFDVGIAEQHAACSAAGLAMAGLHPVVAVYATFLGRAFDQILMDVALHGVAATFVLDRAGITGPDGPSHHGVWDIGLLGLVPGARIAAPRDPARLRELLREAVAARGLTIVRYPKAAVEPDIPAVARHSGVDILLRPDGTRADILLVASGGTARACLDAAAELRGEGAGVTVADPRWILPVNPALVRLAARHQLTVTVEDGCRTSGAGAALALCLRPPATATRVVNLGLPCAFIGHGARSDLLAALGVSGPGIASAALTALRARPPSSPALSWPDGDGDNRRRCRPRSRRR